MTTPNPFAQPDRGDRFTPRDHPEWVGKLFLFYPDSVSQHMGTGQNGQPEPYDAVEADVAIIDLVNPETGQPTVLSNARVGGKALVPQIKKHCGGGMVLGRLAQTAAQGQKSGAFYLAEYSDADVQMATQYINAHPRNAFTQPTAQAAPAQQQAWGQQPQHVSQQLPYDPWQGTPGAAAPAGPPQGQWGTPAATATPAQAPTGAGAPAATAPGSPAPQWGNPAGSAQAAPAQTVPASGSAALDPQLVAFLQSKGVNPEGMTAEQATMIAKTFQAQEPPPF
ncbi:hypothetical protein DMA15_03805 [Streptomyces sp. WAC 01529]|uniref:hypothetical protein n=1 Tax=Streptomyces sp. WAC 01529 TaxID=2203205 RepID=UPI000F719FCA|nr:hypothetical protein [Streptomyces sp. WAC 01529]AZM51818.1 hypothetical protein DMA15_03805 [Streptomyces sp. WAC 01529]